MMILDGRNEFVIIAGKLIYYVIWKPAHLPKPTGGGEDLFDRRPKAAGACLRGILKRAGYNAT